ncbi:hypothetical protein DL96DRAFT_1826640 [Flagelloscypha sp. PMI_526]|nr:hypothetical protein DL96DRAFT_1826640 [Flagelloscypha sp. PMI_526]
MSTSRTNLWGLVNPSVLPRPLQKLRASSRALFPVRVEVHPSTHSLDRRVLPILRRLLNFSLRWQFCNTRLCISFARPPPAMTEYDYSEEGMQNYKRRMNDVGRWAITTEGNRHRFQPAVDTPRPQTAGLPEGSSHHPRSKSIHESSSSQGEGHPRSRSRQPIVPPPGFPGPIVNWRDTPRNQINFPFATVLTPPPPEAPHRSHSHSRSRSEQVAPTPDPNTPPVPFIQPRPGRQQKPAPVPSVIPPGYPEGTTRAVDFGGRPRFVRQEQYLAQYGAQSPAIPLASRSHQQHVPQCSLRYTPQSHCSRALFQLYPTVHPIQQPLPVSAQAPVVASPSPQKPFLKRVFGGIIGSNKGTRTPRPTQPPPVSPASPSRPSSRKKQRSRTKSM